ncbi:myosin regulatory light chain 2, ventricular/cardiac muscle isoform-like [Salvelinus alpinus]
MDLLLFHLPPKEPKKAKKKSAEGANSNVFSIFEQSQIQEFKEVRICLSPYYHDDSADPEETILNTFKVLNPEGKGVLRKDSVTEMLTTQADRFSPEEMEQMFAAFPPDVAGNLDYKNLVHIITHGEEKDQE